MFKISPIQDETTKSEYAKACNTVSIPGYFAYSMINQETGELMGMSQFDINGEEAYISDLKEVPDKNDFEAMFILGRATMNFIDMCGTHKCRASDGSAPRRLLIAIGFKQQDNGEYTCDMTGMFDGHCDGKTVSLD